MKPLTPQSVDDGPSVAEMLDTARVRQIKSDATIKTLRRALRDQCNKHKIAERRLRRELRESQLLLMVGAHELRTLRDGYLRIAQEIESMMKGKHPKCPN